MKYRRSTSFPGKGHNVAHGNIDIGGQGLNNISHGSIDVNAIDDVREQFMQYQVRQRIDHVPHVELIQLII